MAGMINVQTIADEAWDRAECDGGQDPSDTRQDPHGLRIRRDLYNVAGPGGWAVDDYGIALAYRATGYPVMGDTPLSSAKVTWHLPS